MTVYLGTNDRLYRGVDIQSCIYFVVLHLKFFFVRLVLTPSCLVRLITFGIETYASRRASKIVPSVKKSGVEKWRSTTGLETFNILPDQVGN